MSKLTVTIPDDLHQQIRDELERQGITTSQFIEQAITTFFEKPKGVSNMATRTLAFQVSEELLQRIKTFLARYEQMENLHGTSAHPFRNGYIPTCCGTHGQCTYTKTVFHWLWYPNSSAMRRLKQQKFMPMLIQK